MTFSPPHFSFDVNLGQVLLTAVVALLGYGLRKCYMLIARFVDRVHTTEDLLDVACTVVDDHTRALMLANILKAPVVRLRRRREHDPGVFTEADLT